ncbi:MAG: efflux RND transporter permease subunit [Deltaproteobacteria bacterium]|nr:efflux RND transporter permease subunit [Deltaproteobacteria bacterium]
MNLTDICIKRPVLAWMIMAATVLFGLVAGQRIGISQFPDVDFPTISVSLSREGAAPEVMENDVVEIVEENLMQVEGVRTITSTARQGQASVSVELELSRNVDAAVQDVQAKVSQAQQRLPRDLDAPVISKSNPEDNPILWVGVSGPFPRAVLSDYARYRVKERLQTIPGVGEVMMGGWLERNVRIWVDARKLEERGLTVHEISAALRKEHVELPAGRIESGGREIDVRVLGEALDLDVLRQLPIREVGQQLVRLTDVALVEDGFEDARRMGRVNGEPAQGMGIKKQRGANTVAVARAVKAKLDGIRKTLPEGMQLGINFDSSLFVEESVREIEWELALAVTLTGLVCWLFLGSLSSTVNVVLAIPMSLLGTIGVLWALGWTLNTFTLLALSLAVGIVVDDAIMVLENITRHAESGKDRATAARDGTREITFAALAATLAVVAIFLPVVFMEGVTGKFFLQFGVALSLAVLLSYLEAITLAPARCAQILSVSRHDRMWLGRLADRGFELMQRFYLRQLRGALKVPVLVVALAGGLSWGAVELLKQMPAEMVPSQDQSRIMIRMQTAIGSNLETTARIINKAEAKISERPDVARYFGVIGGFGTTSTAGGMLFVTMVPPAERKTTQGDLIAWLRKELNAIPGLRAMPIDLSQSMFSSNRGFPVEFSVRGGDWNGLVKASQDIMRKLRESGVVTDVDSNYQVGQPELRITPDRQRCADVGVSVDDVATAVSQLVGGQRIGKFSQNGRRVDVRVRLLAGQRDRPEELAHLHVRSKSGALVPLSMLVTMHEKPALQGITRMDRERAITVQGNIAQGHSQQEAMALVERLGAELPPGSRVVMSGASMAFRESMQSLVYALLVGVVVAYMVLAAQFNSFLHPVTVLTILPLSVAGAALALWWADKTLNIFSMIGLLLLMGIVKKNSILLVDFAVRCRAEGHSATEAMLQSGAARLRPILMTTVATLMAAVPSALALGPGAEVRGPMALAILGGLTVSTALSLFVVPCFYVVADWGVTRSPPLFRR